MVRFFHLASETGVLVVSLEDDGPAAAAGIREGDIVVGVDDAPVANVDDLQRALGAEAIGREMRLVVLRRGRKLSLAAMPRERTSAGGGRVQR